MRNFEILMKPVGSIESNDELERKRQELQEVHSKGNRQLLFSFTYLRKSLLQNPVNARLVDDLKESRSSDAEGSVNILDRSASALSDKDKLLNFSIFD